MSCHLQRVSKKRLKLENVVTMYIRLPELISQITKSCKKIVYTIPNFKSKSVIDIRLNEI